MRIFRNTIAVPNVASLVWSGDVLMDWVGGARMIRLDGTCERRKINWAFRFDTATATPDGRFAAIYQRRGTKALLLRDGRHLRELNRSYYHAEVYDFPICLWSTVGGRTLLAHCPEDYCRIDIEDAETGERLTNAERKPQDFFHSRLMVNPSGTRMLSAGWVWHPWSAVVYYDIAEALRDPRHLDGVDDNAPASTNLDFAEEGSACWQTDERVLIGGTTDEGTAPDPEDAARIGEPRLHAKGIAVYDVVTKTYLKSVILDQKPGEMMPVGKTHAVCFYEHPRLVSLESGEVVARWDDLDTLPDLGPSLNEIKVPPLAMDVTKRRFAVYSSGKITIIQIDDVD